MPQRTAGILEFCQFAILMRIICFNGGAEKVAQKTETASGAQYNNFVEKVDTWDGFDFMKFVIFL